MPIRRLTLALGAVAVIGLVALGCSKDDKGSSTTTTTAKATSTTMAASTSSSMIGGNVLPPIIITPDMAKEGGNKPIPTIHVGDVVVFNMGTIPVGGNVKIVQNSNPSVFRVDGEGSNNGTVSMNAGGTALAVGTTTVQVGTTKPIENFDGTYVLVITAK